jgi:hypothetical protein
MGVPPMTVFDYENHGRDARATGFSKPSLGTHHKIAIGLEKNIEIPTPQLA